MKGSMSKMVALAVMSAAAPASLASRRIEVAPAINAAPSKDKGRGKGKPARGAKPRGRRTWGGRDYPFSSTRQDARCYTRQYTATTRNGFEIMQTRRAA